MTRSDYDAIQETAAHRYEITHKNGERTVVLVTEAFDGWMAVAVDVDEGGFEPLAERVIAVAATENEVMRRADAWMKEHPKGVKPGGLAGGVFG